MSHLKSTGVRLGHMKNAIAGVCECFFKLFFQAKPHVGETHERTDFLSKDRLSVEGQIQLKRQIYVYCFKWRIRAKKPANRHEQNLQVGENYDKKL